MSSLANAVILGCGYLGRAVADRWRRALTVTATTRTPARIAELEAIAQRAIVLNGNDEPALRSLLQNQHIVLLCVGAPHKDAYAETYLETAKTLTAALKYAPTVRQVIYTSSYAVYGDRNGAWVDETTPVNPADRNGKILAETEQVLLDAAHDSLKMCVFRLSGIYGPVRELVKIFQHTVGTTQPGTGEEASNWVHLDDIVGAIDVAQQQQLQGIYNLTCDVPLSKRELLDRICVAHNLPKVSWDPSQTSVRPYNAKVSNQKLKTVGYQFAYPAIPEAMF
ncbi:MAG: SDR family oxidoreductase [Leptolyngbyaceae cyanobacterium RU_5_1]|nr:SDR family oxidoreductase [Leptolyngbyaceae cyanobacterium RU_5_1]